MIIAHFTNAQAVENIILDFDGRRISVTYDLNYPESSQKFKISLFSSHNNYQKPITLVAGDVGDNIVAGLQKKVIWDLKNELPSTFNDEISIKVKVSAIIANYRIKPLASNAFKRGKKLQMHWEGGWPSDEVKIDLLKNNVFQKTLTQTKNTKRHVWNIPKDFDKGNGYSLRLSNSFNANQNTSSTSFNIKPRMSMLVKIGVPVIIGVLVSVLAGGDGGGEPDTNSELPGPISPGGG